MTNPKLPPILINKAGSVYYVYMYKKALFNHLGDFGRTFQKGTSSSIEAPFRA